MLDEVQRNIPKVAPAVPPSNARRRVDAMRNHFPNALVTDYESLIPSMTNDPKDRHVLAAAVAGSATLIVTANLSDFPAESLEPHNLIAVHPDVFLLDQLDLHPHTVARCVLKQISSYTRPPFTTAEFLKMLATTVPNFASALRPLV